VKLVVDLLSGTRQYCSQGNCLDPAKIVTVVGSYASHNSVEVSITNVSLPYINCSDGKFKNFLTGTRTWR